VTGATDGIGRETARQLLAADMHVLVHGRNETKARREAPHYQDTPPARKRRRYGRTCP
jgi:NAD(P)-dependent dehydrogenase (short-subunit alcohol dehydrogenase family)